MASYVTPKRATAFRCYVELRSQANTKLFQVNPTLASGDVKVSKDGGAFANLATLPVVTPAGGRAVQVDLDATEMTADNVKVVFSDAAGSEWCDLSLLIQTTARQIDDLAWPTVSGRSLDVSAGGEAGLDWANIGSPTTAQNLSGTNIDVDQVVASVTGNVGGDVLGNVDGSVGSVATGGIAAASFAAGAIDAAAIAANAIGASEIANDAITAAKIATGAIDADAVASDAVTKIAEGVFARGFSAAYAALTFEEIVEVCVSALGAKCSGMATTTATFRNLDDSADVIVATVDANGNRTAVTLTP